jgi:hypothetical protein
MSASTPERAFIAYQTNRVVGTIADAAQADPGLVGFLSNRVGPQRRWIAGGGLRYAARRSAGNFPQAFSPVGLINSALNLSRARDRAAERSEP